MELYSIFEKHPVISTDSRVCPKGSIFFALKGDNFNANAFALAALEKGCAYAVVDEAEFAIDERFVLVDDVLETLQELARYHRKKLATPIVGITGTNGKTTTKELIAAVLKEKYCIHFTQGNFNNHIGVPLTLLQLKPEHELAVIEMGANHQGEIKFLAEIACPDYGIITNVGKAHLEGFGSFEGVMKTKGELYDYIASHGKQVFINMGNPLLMDMAAKAKLTNTDKIIGFTVDNENKNTLVSGEIAACSPFLQIHCWANDNTGFDVSTQLIGTYNAENVIAAATIGRFFNLTNDQIKKGLENYIPNNNRSQLTLTENNKLVVDAYNANPTSMKAAILNFAQMQVPAKALILGDMLELGSQSASEHQAMIDLLEEKQFEKVYLVGSEFKATRNSFCCFANVQELTAHLTQNPVKDHYILIKGSRGIRLEQAIQYL